MTEAPGSGNASTATKSEPKAPGKSGIRGSDIVAGALVASIAAIIGGQLGALGSVVSAFVVSVVSGIARPLIQHPLRQGEDIIHDLATKASAASRSAKTSGDDQDQPDEVEIESALMAAVPDQTPARSTHRIRVAVITTLVAFLIAFAAIFVVQAISGNQLSPGTGQLQGQVTGNTPGVPAESSASTDEPTATATAASPSASATPSMSASSTPSSPQTSASASQQPTPTAAGTDTAPTTGEAPPTQAPNAEVTG